MSCEAPVAMITDNWGMDEDGKPLLLIDVDGVISLFGFDPARPPAGRFQMVDGIVHLLSATAGEHLRALAREYELTWCTGWEERANDYLPFALKLPGPLRCLTFGAADKIPAAHWKLAAIDAFAGPSRSLAWIDDSHEDSCERWAHERPGPTLLVATQPAIGITDEHVATLVDWASGRAGGASEAPRPNTRAAAGRRR